MDISVRHGKLGADAADFISKPRRLLIDNEWVEAKSGKRFAVFDPATSQQITEVAEADAADVDLAVAAARRAFDGGEWPRVKPSARGQLLWRLADLMEAHADELAEIESLDNGKPVTVARAADLPLAIDMFRYMVGMATKVRGHLLNLSTPGDYHSYILREPVGVVGQIIPWNFPLLMAAWKLVPALAVRLHRGAENGPADAALGAAPGRADPGSRFPAGRGQHPAGLRRNGGCRAGQPSGRGQGSLHRQHGGGQADRPRGDRQPEKGDAGTGRQVAGDCVPRRGHGPRDPGRRQCDLLQPRPDLLRRLAPLRAQQGV